MDEQLRICQLISTAGDTAQNGGEFGLAAGIATAVTDEADDGGGYAANGNQSTKQFVGVGGLWPENGSVGGYEGVCHRV